MKGMAFLLIGGILTVYIVLGMLYESFIHPLTILSGLPSACAGALLTLWLFPSIRSRSTPSSASSCWSAW